MSTREVLEDIRMQSMVESTSDAPRYSQLIEGLVSVNIELLVRIEYLEKQSEDLYNELKKKQNGSNRYSKYE